MAAAFHVYANDQDASFAAVAIWVGFRRVYSIALTALISLASGEDQARLVLFFCLLDTLVISCPLFYSILCSGSPSQSFPQGIQLINGII